MSATDVPNNSITAMAIKLARANELNLKRILAKGEEVEDKDILDALVDPLHRTNLIVDDDKGCFVKVENRVDKALATFTPVEDSTLKTSIALKRKNKRSGVAPDVAPDVVPSVVPMQLGKLTKIWRGYAIDFSLVLAFLVIVLYGFSST